MADFGSPVAGGNAYNPQQGMQTLGALYNIKNAQAQLANTQASLPGIQATSQQAQQSSHELSALHDFTSKAMNDPAYKNPDGTINTQKFQQDAMGIAGTYGQAYIGQATQNLTEGVKNRQAMLDLSNNQRKTIGGYFAAVAAKPNATMSDYLDAAQQAREVSTDPSYQRSIDALLMHTPPVNGKNPAIDSQNLRQYARNVALATNAPEADQSAPQMGTVQAPGGLQPYQGSPQSPIGVGPVGQPLKQGITPQIVTQPGTGAPAVVGPGGQASPISQAGGQPGQTNWWQPAPGQLAQLAGNTQGVVQRTQDAVKLANSSPQAMDALNRINAIAEQGIATGTAFPALKDMKNLAASLGLDTKTATNASELAKNVARYEAARAGAIGDTDASKALTEASGPNYKMDNAALRAVTMQSLAVEKQTQMYAKIMTESPDPQTAMQREQQFRSIPNLVQTIELGQMKSAKEVDAFMKRYGLSGADIQKSRQQLQALGLM